VTAPDSITTRTHGETIRHFRHRLQLFTCESCQRQAPQLIEALVAFGLTDLGPHWLCSQCLAAADAEHDIWLTIELTGRVRGEDAA